MKMKLAVTLLALAAASAEAQESTEPRYDALVSQFQKEYFNLGILLQVVGDVQAGRNQPGQNGFSIANARFRVSGLLDNGFDYVIRVNLAEAPALLDAAAGMRFAPAFRIKAGMFKAPFSREFLTGAGAIDFVNRSQVVSALAPMRQVGVQVHGTSNSGLVEYSAGAFNGNARAISNDNNELLYVGRVSLWPVRPDAANPGNRIEVAFNAATSNDAAAPIGLGFIPAFNGSRALLGADARWQAGPVLVAGELITSRFKPVLGPRRSPQGFHATFGYSTTPRTQLLARWDSFSPDGIGPDQDLLILGLNFWPTKPTELQVNLVTPTNRGGIAHEQVLINLQVAF
jgi:hypothetical protein